MPLVVTPPTVTVPAAPLPTPNVAVSAFVLPHAPYVVPLNQLVPPVAFQLPLPSASGDVPDDVHVNGAASLGPLPAMSSTHASAQMIRP